MALSGEDPPPSGDSPPPSEDEGWWEVLAASPLGEIALGAAICAAGGLLIFGMRRSPMTVLVVGVGSVLLAVLAVSRLVARAGRPWVPSQYVLFAALFAGGLALGSGILYVGWAMLCDC